MRTAARTRCIAGALALAAGTLPVAVTPAGAAESAVQAVPTGFHEYTVLQGLSRPTAVELAPDGRIFVAEKRGVVKVFANADDTSATIVADLRTPTYNAYDRGLLGLALAPNFPADPSLYVLYTYDALPGGTAPHWGRAGADDDNCPSPPGPLTDGCVVQGRLSRLPLTGAGGVWNGQEQVLLTGWCQQFTSHSIGHLEFGPDGALYVSGGDGAGFGPADWGQRGAPRNPCGDPPGGVGATLAPPTAEGGALRAQDLRTSGDPAGLNGAILRLDPATGQARAGNPGAGSSDPNVRRIVAHGMRNPFRFTLRPGTDELWIADVGNTLWEEVNRSIGNDGTVDNFGWPCREGPVRTPIYDSADLDICENLYAAGPGAVREPFFTYHHDDDVVAGDGCHSADGSALSGIAIAPDGSSYPDRYDGALFLADAIRGCIWTMREGASGAPDPSTVEVFARPVSATELEFGPDGALWYVDMYGGAIRRIGYSATNQPPTAVITPSATSGNPPLTVLFDAGRSSDPDAGDVLTYAWDLDDDGAFDDGTATTAGRTFATAGLYDVSLRVRDAVGATHVATVQIGVGPAPVATISTPAAGAVAAVGATVAFSGRATSGVGGPALPASALSWTADLLHCPSACHHHPGIFSAEGVASGSFVLPDHEYPAAVELRLTATAPNGRTSTVTRRVDFRGTPLTLRGATASGGALAVPIMVNDVKVKSPVVRTVATNGTVTISAPATMRSDLRWYRFVSWSDGGARTHDVKVPATATTLTARYEPTGAMTPSPPVPRPRTR